MAQSFWSRYKRAIDFKRDLKDLYIRPTTRYATLDGARAITILLMVLFHVMFGIVMLFHGDFQKIDYFISNFPHYLRWMWQVQGSDPLFVMCGLLVAYTLFREYKKDGSIQIWRFYRRRLMRILPLFFVAILLYLPTDKDNLSNLWSNLLFLSSFLEGQRHIIPVAWSLDVQVQFYFLLPFLVLMAHATRRPITVMVLLIVASLAWRYWVVASDPEIYTHLRSNVRQIAGEQAVLRARRARGRIFHGHAGGLPSFCPWQGVEGVFPSPHVDQYASGVSRDRDDRARALLAGGRQDFGVLRSLQSGVQSAVAVVRSLYVQPWSFGTGIDGAVPGWNRALG